MKEEAYETVADIMRKIHVTEEIIQMLKHGAEPIVTITAIGGRLFKREIEENIKITHTDVPIYIEMLERWKTEMKKQFEETQDKLETVVPYEEYHGGGLSIICPHCDTQVAIPECDVVKVVECPVCLKKLNISWRHKEKEQ